MKSYEYKVIGYADSDLMKSGTLFAIVIYLPLERHVCGFIRSDWKEALGATVSADQFMVEGFLKDLRYCGRNPGTPASSFFDFLEGMEVGPMRIFASGRYIRGSLPFEGSPPQSAKKLSTASFLQLIGQLRTGYFNR